jgi:7-cyano-7-deazaguanine synthase
MRSEPEVLVLLSGGVDSAATVAFYLEFGRPPAALFVDYAQPARREEARAAADVAAHFRVPLSVATWSGPKGQKGVGLIPGRNLFLLAAALLERPPSASVLALGLHAGTPYPDSSPPFVRAADAAVQSGEPGVTVATPFLEWPKGDVYAYARRARVPFSLTYSCEAADGPCGRCLSCGDRKTLDVGA